MAEPEYLVIDRPDDGRFALTRDGGDVGFAAYDRVDGTITFTHTEIDPDQQDHGLGTRLVRGALDAVRQGSQDRVASTCPFVTAFLAEHPEYQELERREPPHGSPSRY